MEVIALNSGVIKTDMLESCSKLLSQCTASKSVTSGMEVHAHMIRFGLSEDPNLRNHLINLYSKCRCFGYVRKLGEGSTEPDLVSWSSFDIWVSTKWAW